MTERHQRGLAELADLGLELARSLQARAVAAPEMAEASGLAMAFHRISRSVRQTYALEARLEREARRDLVDHHERAAKAAKAERGRREDLVQKTVERLIWTECEADEAERLIDELHEMVELEALSEAFVADPVETVIARIRVALGLAPEAPAEDIDPLAHGPPVAA